MYLCILGYTKKSATNLSNDAYAMFFCVFYFWFLDISICYGYSFELHWQVNATQMGNHNICLYKEVNKKYTGCNLKITELLDRGLIIICAVIRSNKVYLNRRVFVMTNQTVQICRLIWDFTGLTCSLVGIAVPKLSYNNWWISDKTHSFSQKAMAV